MSRDPLRPSEPDVGDFRRDIGLITNTFNVLQLSEAVRLNAEGRLPAGAAAVTFDDGYADNHTLAVPILDEMGVPATFFIAVDAVDRGIMWNDLLLETLAERGMSANFDVLPDSIDRERLANDPAIVAPFLLESLKYLPARERMQYATAFYSTSTGADAPRLMMTREQVADLGARGFEIGGHTLSHPILNRLTDSEARIEIEGCRDWIDEVVGQKPTTFAYPNGIPGKDFTRAHRQMVREAGFTGAVSTDWAAAKFASNRYAIPRVGPWWRLGFGLVSGLARIYASSYKP